MKTSIFVLVAVAVLAAPLGATAEIYRWTNERGIVSYTDNLGSIPAKFRTKAVLIDAPVPAFQEVVIEQGGAQEKPVAAEKTERRTPVEKKKVYGDKDEAAWKKEADRINFAVADTEKQIIEMRDRLSDTSKMSRAEYLSLQNSLKFLEQRLATQQQKRETFLESARSAGAPL